jgi:hypothetical protein
MRSEERKEFSRNMTQPLARQALDRAILFPIDELSRTATEAGTGVGTGGMSRPRKKRKVRHGFGLGASRWALVPLDLLKGSSGAFLGYTWVPLHWIS